MSEDGTKTTELVEHGEDTVMPNTPCVIPCVVGVNASQTIPTGSYSSVKVGVHLSITCEPEDVDDAFETVSSWVGEKLGSMTEAVAQEYGNN